MRRVLLALFITSGLGCKGPSAKLPASPTGGLSATQYARLKAVNDSQVAALAHVRNLAAGRGSACTMNESGRSTANIDGWGTRSKMDASERCPINYLNQWTYDVGRGVLEYKHELKAQRSVGVLNRRAGGVIKRVSNGATKNIEGSLRFEPMMIEGVGAVEVNVTTAQNYARRRGTGEIRVTVQAHDWSHQGVVRWRTGSSPRMIYEVDGGSITAEGFAALFSSYGVPEIMANSMKMR